MSPILEAVHKSLINEALSSPKLLSDLAGLETYVAESYNSRSFTELLQNSDDAGATRMLVKRYHNYLLVANDGRKFTEQDFESLCRSAASNKERRTNIGFRGIGFKSVVGFAEQVHLFSGEIEALFSRERTLALIPEADSVPLIRIPHSIDSGSRSELIPLVNQAFQEGYQTIFVFSNLIANYVEDELLSFDPTAILFLNHVEQVIFDTHVKRLVKAERQDIDPQTSKVHLTEYYGSSHWTIFKASKASIAIREEQEGYAGLNESEGLVHAFLPTSESTGYGLKINADVSTDPSRLRVLFDNNTDTAIRSAAQLYIDVLDNYLSDRSNFKDHQDFVEPFIPLFDPRIAKLQKRSFKTEFTKALKEVANERFADLYIKPEWLNSLDYQRLVDKLSIRAVHRDIINTDGLSVLLKFLGAKELTIDIFSDGLKSESVTTQGAADFTAQLVKQYSTKQITSQDIDPTWRVWSSGKEIKSLSEISRDGESLDTDFIDLVTERVGINTELPRLLTQVVGQEAKDTLILKQSQIVLPALVDTPRTTNPSSQLPRVQLSLTKWRGAEQQILEIFNTDGWKAKDVSRQNLGYDIEAISPNGQEVFIEVKLLNYVGQNFTVTSNEEATAREKGESYMIALVLQQSNQLDIMFVKNPASVLQLERQCRQWVWLCSSYEFEPVSYPLKG